MQDNLTYPPAARAPPHTSPQSMFRLPHPSDFGAVSTPDFIKKKINYAVKGLAQLTKEQRLWNSNHLDSDQYSILPKTNVILGYEGH